MEIVAFNRSHVKGMTVQPAQAALSYMLTPEIAVALEKQSSFTAFIDGRPVGAAGVLPQWEHRSVAWAYLTKVTPHQFIAIHKAVKFFLDGCDIPRLEITVDCDFTAGHRWAKMLGFTMEAERMIKYAPDGRDCALYARVL